MYLTLRCKPTFWIIIGKSWSFRLCQIDSKFNQITDTGVRLEDKKVKEILINEKQKENLNW